MFLVKSINCMPLTVAESAIENLPLNSKPPSVISDVYCIMELTSFSSCIF